MTNPSPTRSIRVGILFQILMIFKGYLFARRVCLGFFQIVGFESLGGCAANAASTALVKLPEISTGWAVGFQKKTVRKGWFLSGGKKLQKLHRDY